VKVSNGVSNGIATAKVIELSTVGEIINAVIGKRHDINSKPIEVLILTHSCRSEDQDERKDAIT
jgi:hypothetical protein